MSTDTGETVEIRIGDETLELPVVTGSEGEKGIDISTLRAKTGYITLDPGYANTGSCQSDITFIDGEKGILRYRGYPIEQVAEKCSFLEVCYLLIKGELPDKESLAGFVDEVKHHTMLHENFRPFYLSMPKAAHPMPALVAALGAMATIYPQPEAEEELHKAVIRLVAKMPTMAAYAYKHSIGQPFMYPRNDLGYASNFLQMMFATPCEEYEVDPVVAKALDLLLVLHADHEQNCSTSTVRMVGSSQSNLYASISAGVGALWGPLHGGANQKVIEMLEAIKAEGDVDRFVTRAKDKTDDARLMGFGHRVYKNYDPRASILKKACGEVLERVGGDAELLDIARRLEEIALEDEYFISRNLYPNVDFYSGVIYKAIGIPIDMFTVMFAMGRLPGWICQWLELRKDPAFRIGRPRQIYIGATKRDVPDQR